MSLKPDIESRVQLVRILTTGHLRVRLNRNGAFISAENALAIVAAVLVVALIVVLI
jgi:hypothetical protein